MSITQLLTIDQEVANKFSKDLNECVPLMKQILEVPRSLAPPTQYIVKTPKVSIYTFHTDVEKPRKWILKTHKFSCLRNTENLEYLLKKLLSFKFRIDKPDKKYFDSLKASVGLFLFEGIHSLLLINFSKFYVGVL